MPAGSDMTDFKEFSHLSVPTGPYGVDIGAVIVAGITAAAGGAIVIASLLAGGSGFWLVTEFVAGIVALGAMFTVLGFGAAATLRRGAYLPLVLGFILAPALYFLWWALYRRRVERREFAGIE